MMEKKEIFQVGDKVFDYVFGWGEVIEIRNKYEFIFPVIVRFGYIEFHYTPKGRGIHELSEPTLSFTEYTLKGFSQERPKFKEGDECVYVDRNRVFCKHVWDKNIQECYGDNLLTLKEFKEYINKNY